MKQSLQLKIGQQLTMTPQLQQAIRLLQLSSLDLQSEIQDALDSNPLLEVEGETSNDADQSETRNIEERDDSQRETSDVIKTQEMPDELPVDSSWDDTYSSHTPANGAASSGKSFDGDFEVYQGSTSESLQDHLLWQMQLSHFSEEDTAIAEAIIEAIDDNGYLMVDVDEIIEAVRLPEVEAEEVCMVLKRIQHFDPIGVGARSVSECLAIQLRQLSDDTEYKQVALCLVTEHMDLLGSRDFRTIQRKLKLSEDDLRQTMRLIQQLHPHPGEQVAQQPVEYVIPDVAVTKKNGRWMVELNPDSVPKLKVNEEYAALSKAAKSVADSQYIKNHTQEARWFIKSLESRNDTLLKVANCIVQRQQGFFEHGEEAMKPMVLNDVAETVDMHESTISRVTTQKYLHCPSGVFELKYFFSSHVSTEGGGECSSTAIRALIKKMVAAENRSKPLSDSKIAELIAEQGIQVARRTIAKYRESLNIPSSSQRKSLL
ncbi:RNA polymerase factor sigma-54 [Idiomarina sp. PL1-037]|uniref:RNA polymerase factor sigma-54 n=1 Tax=Idiomarina TaxID=135575 RepID=UPI00294AC329|nr:MULTISPECIES: RNA polymerase factor sigma-54 [unclassified Idiomarina]MDV6327898.1 RNA polymerase factor sigma-54 [Idiomarina sp. Sol25]WQC53368.1 RNA polymerase factor sigma-54 [Idiomarina sp. PL1-037]